MRKIGMLIPQFPGQTHMFFWREIKALEARGVVVSVFSTRKPPKGLISHDWSDEAIARTRYLGTPKPFQTLAAMASLNPRHWMKALTQHRAAFLKDFVISVGAARALKLACAREGIAHVHVHSCGRAALVAAFSRLMGGPAYSLTLHGPLSDYGVGQELKWQHAAFATIITRKLLAEMQRDLGPYLPDRLAIQPMGVDTSTLTRKTPYVPAKGRTVRVFSCGRLNVVKGHQDLLRAIKILRDQGMDIELRIAGEDDDGGSGFRAVLERDIRDLGLENHAQLLGAISADEVHRALLDSHIFALASWHEPLGVAYMEAMSCAVPVIGTDSGGVPELLTHGVDGMMVPPKSPEDLAAAIRELAEDEALAKRLSKAGRARVETAFHSDVGAETLIREIFG